MNEWIFKRWTKERCLTALNDLSENVAMNIQSVSNPKQGGISYNSLEHASILAKLLEARINELDGIKTKPAFKRGVFFGVGSWRNC